MKSFTEVVLNELKSMSTQEVIRIKSAIENMLSEGDMRMIATSIKKENSTLQAIKYVKDKTGWALKECKQYVDNLYLPS